MEAFPEYLTDQLLDSIAEVGGINLDRCILLPSRRAVAEITQSLLHLMFPGFYDDDPLKDRQVREAIQKQTQKLYPSLVTEIQKSLEFFTPENQKIDDYAAEATRIAQAFLNKLTNVREVLSTDVEAAFDGDPAATSHEEIILAYPGIDAIAVQRVAHELHMLHVPLIPRMMTEWAHSRTGIDIHPGAIIGRSFFIDHGTGVVIGETTEIGDRVKMYHSVTLGARSTSGGQSLRGVKRHPTIQNDVTIYPGSTILGGETVIGEGSVIGGNVFLIHSIPPQHIVFYEERSLVIQSKTGRDGKSYDFQI